MALITGKKYAVKVTNPAGRMVEYREDFVNQWAARGHVRDTLRVKERGTVAELTTVDVWSNGGESVRAVETFNN